MDLDVHRNLLLGILSYQLRLVDREGLMATLRVWIADKSQPFDDLLRAKIPEQDKSFAFILALVEQHLQSHPLGPDLILSVVGSNDSLLDELLSFGDPDIDATLEASRRTATGPEVTTDWPPRTHSTTVERFRILRPHARGGLGQVSVARDTELNREVALKEILSQFSDSPARRNRFLLEAEITGGLEHPGIVPVYSLGQYADGRPFYAMRFIRGDSLAEAIHSFHSSAQTRSDRRLWLRKLLGRLVDVCNAIEYAHNRGVLHRDLKPGNIMLGRYGETLVVDWGLAKAGGRPEADAEFAEIPLQPSSGDSTTRTEMGSAIGTPAFMSPEQSEGRLDLLGPTTDVYSLGATMYCLLTGRAPFQGKNKEEILRNVRRGDAPRPRDIKPDIPRPLEAICRKAMAVKPQDRYESVALLAEDIERWLADEVVSVYREPWLTQLARLMRNHKTVVAAASALLLATLVGLAIVTTLTRSQNRNLRIARDAAERQQNRAEGNLEIARDLALSNLDVAERILSRQAEMAETRRKMTTRAREVFEEFHRQAPEDAAIQSELAKVLRYWANVERIQNPLEALSASQTSAALYQGLLAESPEDNDLRDRLAEHLRDQGNILKTLGRLNEAISVFTQAQALVDELRKAMPAEVDYRRTEASLQLDLGSLQLQAGQVDAGRQNYRLAVDAYRELVAHPQQRASDPLLLLMALRGKGESMRRSGRLQEAEKELADASVWAQGLNQDDQNVRHLLARVRFEQSLLLASQSQTLEAITKPLDEAIQIWRALAEQRRDGPLFQTYRLYLAQALTEQATKMLRDNNSPEVAKATLDDAHEILTALCQGNEDVPSYRAALANNLASLARWAIANGQPDQTMNYLRRALEAQEQAAGDSPENASYQEDLRKRRQDLSRFQDNKGLD